MSKQRNKAVRLTKKQLEDLSKFNAAMCSSCGYIVVSLSRHDFNVCPCKQTSDKLLMEFEGKYGKKAVYKNNGSLTTKYKKLLNKMTGISVDGGFSYHCRGWYEGSFPIELELVAYKQKKGK